MAFEFYVTVEGTKQGKWAGETTLDAHEDKLTGISFHYAVSSPRDLASGMASGKRQHGPVSFVKEWGAASPQFFSALCTNESLKSVFFEFVRLGDKGGEEVYQTLKLVNASVSAIEQYIDGEGVGDPGNDDRALEKISFAFARIEMENKDGKTSAVDDISGKR